MFYLQGSTSFFSYLQHEKRFSPNTILAYQTDLKQFEEFVSNIICLSSEDGSELRHTHIRTWVVALMKDNVGARSINRKLSALKSYFKYLKKQGLIDDNPMQKVLAPKTAKRLPVVIEQKNLNILLDDIVTENSDSFKSCRDRIVIELLYNTGIRRAELIGMKTNSIDFSKRQIMVIGKGNKQRFIPFGKNLDTLLSDYLAIRSTTFPTQKNASLILTDKGEEAYPKLIYNIVHAQLSLVTTEEKRSPHILRHSFATHLSNNGADLNAIKELLGHSSLAATQVYTHNSIDRLKKIYEQAFPRSEKED